MNEPTVWLMCTDGEVLLRYDFNQNMGQKLNTSSNDDAKGEVWFPISCIFVTFATWQQYSGDPQKVREDRNRKRSIYITLYRGESSRGVFVKSHFLVKDDDLLSS